MLHPLLALPPSPPPPPESTNWPGKPAPRPSARMTLPGRVAASVSCGERRLRVSGNTVQQVIAGIRPYLGHGEGD